MSQRGSSLQKVKQLHFRRIVRTWSRREQVDPAFTAALMKMSYANVEAAAEHSKRLNRLATPTGTTPVYLHFTKVHASPGKGIVGRRAGYFTRGLDDVDVEAKTLAGPAPVSAKIEYLERSAPRMAKGAADVEFIVTNMGETAAARGKTAGLIEAAERSVKDGGKRRRQVSRAVVLGSVIAALPAECTIAQRRAIAARVARVFEKRNVFVLAVGHRPSGLGDARNHHLHLLFSLRPFTRGEGGEIVFEDKVDRELQGPRFLKGLREALATASNEALAEAGAARRVFAGTYESAGLPAASSRSRRAIQEYRPGEGARWSGERIALLQRLVQEVEASATAQLHRRLKTVKARRQVAVDQLMQHVLQHELFWIDRDAQEPMVVARGLRRAGQSWTLAEFDRAQHEEPSFAWLQKTLRKAGSAARTWLLDHADLVMRAWRAEGTMTIGTIDRLGGKLIIAPSGAVKVLPPPGGYKRNPFFSWLADVARNQIPDVVTRNLIGCDVDFRKGKDIPPIDTSDPVERYVAALATTEALPPAVLASARHARAKQSNSFLCYETVTEITESLERELLTWKRAPYLVDRHRELVLWDYGRVPAGLEAAQAAYTASLNDVRPAAEDVGRLWKAVPELLRSAGALFGPTLWKTKLRADLLPRLIQLAPGPASHVYDLLVQVSASLPDGTPISAEDRRGLAKRLEAEVRAERAWRHQHEIRAGEARSR